MNNPFKSIKPFLVKHEPEILMYTGISGLIFATVWTVKSTVKAVRLYDAKRLELKKDKLGFKDTIKTVWKCYIPPVVGAVVSVPCIIAGSKVYSKRNAAIAAAYTIAETSLQEYKEKTKEIVGEKKEKEIHEAISNDKLNKVGPSENILLPREGEYMFLESITGRYFKSSYNKILQACNELNAEALGGSDEITLSDWLTALGLQRTSVSDSLGWTTANGKNGLLSISIDGGITPDDKVPCGVIYYVNEPRYLD